VYFIQDVEEKVLSGMTMAFLPFIRNTFDRTSTLLS
jgi:hypothetical protein